MPNCNKHWQIHFFIWLCSGLLVQRSLRARIAFNIFVWCKPKSKYIWYIQKAIFFYSAHIVIIFHGFCKRSGSSIILYFVLPTSCLMWSLFLQLGYKRKPIPNEWINVSLFLDCQVGLKNKQTYIRSFCLIRKMY